MATPSITDLGTPGESLQRMRTGWSDDFTDQHGRRFAANYDLGNQRPKEELRPVDSTPPWIPPMRFIKWERHGSFRFRWDYESMADELSSDTDVYYRDVNEFIVEHKPLLGFIEIGAPVPHEILRGHIGKPPLSPALPLACLAGDAYMLGIIGAPVNDMLKALIHQTASGNSKHALEAIKALLAQNQIGEAVPTRAPEADPLQKAKRSIHSQDELPPVDPNAITYNEFVRECKRTGRDMSMPDIVAAWREHKAFLKETDIPATAATPSEVAA